jgi:hypothetical protein
MNKELIKMIDFLTTELFLILIVLLSRIVKVTHNDQVLVQVGYSLHVQPGTTADLCYKIEVNDQKAKIDNVYRS